MILYSFLALAFPLVDFFCPSESLKMSSCWYFQVTQQNSKTGRSPSLPSISGK